MPTRPPGWWCSAEVRYHKEPHKSTPGCHQPPPTVVMTLCPAVAGARGSVRAVGLLLFCLLFSRAESKQAMV